MQEIKIYQSNGLQAGTLYRQNFGNLLRDHLYRWEGTEGNIINDVGLTLRDKSIVVDVYLRGLGSYEFTIPEQQYKILK